MISPETYAEPGDWSTDRAPFQHEIMDVYNNRKTHTIVVMASSQVGKTEIINNIIGYSIDKAPCPLLIVQPTLDMGKAWSKDRLSPMLRDTPALTGKLSDNKRVYKVSCTHCNEYQTLSFWNIKRPYKDAPSYEWKYTCSENGGIIDE